MLSSILQNYFNTFLLVCFVNVCYQWWIFIPRTKKHLFSIIAQFYVLHLYNVCCYIPLVSLTCIFNSHDFVYYFNYIITRKFKQRWSRITLINKMNNCHSHEKDHNIHLYDVWNPGSGLGQAQTFYFWRIFYFV